MFNALSLRSAVREKGDKSNQNIVAMLTHSPGRGRPDYQRKYGYSNPVNFEA